MLDVSEKLYRAATDCICAMLYVCEDLTKYFALGQVLKNRVIALLPVFQAAVQCEDSDR